MKNALTPSSGIDNRSMIRKAIILVVVLGLIGGGYYYYEHRPVPTAPAEVPSQRITTELAFFATDTVPIRTKTIVKIPFIPPPQPTEVWLSLQTDTGQENLLVSHPVLDRLTWPHTTNFFYTLYQRSQTFKSVEEFLQNQPKGAVIQADAQIIEKGLLPEETTKILGVTESDFEKTDFILTTHKPHYEEDGYQIYETIIDTSKGSLNDGKLGWVLMMKGVSEENPFIIKGVQINYAQPRQN